MIHLTKRFEGAVLALVGNGPVKQRLRGAYARYLEDLHPGELPDSLRERYERLHSAMHSAAPIGKEGSLKTTVQKMSFAEASDYAGKIVELYIDVLRCLDREPLKLVRNEEPAPQPRVSAGR
jgi:hypothetical protein